MKPNVGIFCGGLCALAFGNSAVEAPIEIVKSAAIKIAIVLPFRFCIFLFLQFYFALRKSIENTLPNISHFICLSLSNLGKVSTNKKNKKMLLHIRKRKKLNKFSLINFKKRKKRPKNKEYTF
jgi:hypothetical protein